MKIKIKVKELVKGCFPTISDKGDWIDLKSAEDVVINPGHANTLKKDGDNKVRKVTTPMYYVPLGVAIELPKGYEAIIASRSSCPNKIGVFIPNGIGIIDNCYNGDGDEWMYIASPLRETSIKKFDRVCQFRIQLSQKATLWQKIKWLFSSGVELVKVDSLGNENRNGFGSTGK